MTDDLVTWLRAQLDEDERVALDAKRAKGRWRWDHGFGQMCDDPTCPFGALVDEDDDGSFVLMEVHGYDVRSKDWGAEHIVRHNPARVLAEVEAKRRLVEAVLNYEAKIDGEWGCCHSADGIAEGLCPETPPDEIKAVRLLALPYADRPGYREEWRPSAERSG